MTNVVSQLIAAQVDNGKTTKKYMEMPHSNRMSRELSRRIKAMETDEHQQGLPKLQPPSNADSDKMDNVGCRTIGTSMHGRGRQEIHPSKRHPFLVGTTKFNFQRQPGGPSFPGHTQWNIPNTTELQPICSQTTGSNEKNNNCKHQTTNMWEPYEWLEKVQESTAFSMSQVNFCHYMAGTFNPTIAIMNVKMAEMPLTTRYAPALGKKDWTSCFKNRQETWM